ncbi:hypothetical protein [Thermococcus sp.]|uniref:hypothetical protein n=1 Tax=Thermococcus sp. TaxID=35749 RepID=UPI0025FCA446|nr:hypothetical protein [Thermococcus sp.]
MIVVDTSVFIDLFFEYRPDRTGLSEELFRIIEGKPIFEPDQSAKKFGINAFYLLEGADALERIKKEMEGG